MSAVLPDGVGELLTRVDSFEKLELVVALYGAPRSTMTVDELSQLLKISRDETRRTALELRGASLVVLTSSGAVQLLPPTTRDLELVGKLVALYDQDRLAVVKAMGQIAVDRIRNMASRAFAEAFVIRKKAGDDHG